MGPRALERPAPAPRSAPFSERNRALMLLSAVIIGLGFGSLGVPALRKIPNDLQRTSVILRALKSRRPAVVVFGDSVIMNGVDAAIISAQLPGSPQVLNLSSTGQTLAESYLYYQELPRSVQTVVQAVRVPYLFSPDPEPAMR